MNSNVEASLDLIVTEKDKPSESDDDFVEVYLPYDDDEGPNKLEEWRAYKYKTSNSESSAVLSTMLHSDRRISFYSKPGSIVDSFAVNLQSLNK